jgi:hypothetical protein
VRFGTVVTDTAAITDGLLDQLREPIATALGNLEGQVEYVIHGRYTGDVALREVMEENPEAERLREAIGDGSEDDTREARIQLGDFINRAVEAKRQQDTTTVADAVGDVTTSMIAREPSHEDDAVYIAVLVHADDEKRLHHTVDDLARQWDSRIRLRTIGPMAAYDFAALPGD